MMEFDKAQFEKAMGSWMAAWDTCIKATDRSLQMAESASQLAYSSLRESLGEQAQLTKATLAAKDAEAGSALLTGAWQTFQAKWNGLQQQWMTLGTDYFEGLVSDLESRKQEVKRGAEEIKLSFQTHFPQGANAFAQTIDTWVDMTTRTFDQATAQRQRLTDFSKVLADLSVPAKIKRNGVRAG